MLCVDINLMAFLVDSEISIIDGAPSLISHCLRALHGPKLRTIASGWPTRHLT